MIALAAAAFCAPIVMAQGQADRGRAPVVPSGTAQIGGVITSPSDRGEERPLRRVLVRLASPDFRGARETATDDAGRFVFVDLPAGRYTLTAIRPGYLTMAYGAKRLRDTGTPVTLAAGQRELELRLSLPPGGVVTGTITDEAGRPIANAGVEVLERTLVGGVVTFARAGGDVTDDRGAYRVYGLPAGTFVVVVGGVDQLNQATRQTTAADLQWALQPRSPGAGGAGAATSPPPSPVVALAPVYYPGTTDPRSATPIVVEAGKERAGIDLRIQFVPMARVSGTLTRPDGRPTAGMSVTLQPESPAGLEFTIGVRQTRPGPAAVSAAGEFVFPSVAPGRYSLTARLGTQAGTLWAKEPVDVAGDVTGLHVAMKPAVTISGRVAMAAEATSAPPNLTALRVSLYASTTGLSGSSLQTSLSADGQFTLEGVIPGSHRLEVFIPAAGLSAAGPGWAVKSAVTAGRDVFDRYFDVSGDTADVVITLTDRIASLSGRLLDIQGQAAPGFFVLLIPVDRSLWAQRLARAPRTVRPGTDGIFRFENVPAGEYYVAASTDVEAGQLFNAEYLEQFLPAAIKLTIAPGEKKVQDLKIGG